jgi:outer membrane immunogenic protein
MTKSISAAMVGASLLCLGLPAAAADLQPRVYTKAPAYAASVYDWSGFYVGAHVGYAWGDERDNLSTTLGAPADRFNVQGAVGGVHAGYNWQSSQFVLGIEGDVDGSGVKGSKAFDVSVLIPFVSLIEYRGALSLKSDWQASLRARAGYAANNWLLYVTGGVAFADAQSDLGVARNLNNCEGICVFLPGVASSGSGTMTGWTAGIGTEYAFSKNWIGRAEVRYSDFGSKTFALSDGVRVLPTQVKFDQTSATLGISYKF